MYQRNGFYASKETWLKTLNFEGMSPEEAFSMLIENKELIAI